MEFPNISDTDSQNYGLNETIDLNNREVQFLQYHPTEFRVVKPFQPYPIKQIPLLGELGMFANYFSHVEKIELKSVDDSFGKYLEDEQDKVLEQKHQLLEEPNKNEKRSSLITTLDNVCSKAVIRAMDYDDSLLKGDDKLDYYSNENLTRYLYDYVPKTTKTIVILMSDLIYSDRLSPKLFYDIDTKKTYKQIAKDILDGDLENRAENFFRLASLGLSVIKQKNKEQKIKIITPRRHSTAPMIFNEHGKVNLTANTTSGEN